MRRGPDWLTLAAIAVVVYGVSSLIHEGLGHGGTCVLVGGRPQVLSSMHFENDGDGLADSARRWIAAGGTLANLIAAAIGFGVMRWWRFPSITSWYALWLFVVVNLLMATGYPFFSGVSGVGDWAVVTRGLTPAWLWRLILTGVGAVSYYAAVNWAMRALLLHLDVTDRGRVRCAFVHTLIPYFTGFLLFVCAGLLNPIGLALVIISAMPASLGGTSGLAWGPCMLFDPAIPASPVPVEPLPRSWAWIVAGVVFGVAFILILGPGVHLAAAR